MKGVLFILTICSFVGVGNATCNGTECALACRGTQCAQSCKGSRCGHYCEGYECAAQCKLQACGNSCIGNSCAKGCDGPGCAGTCIGKNCAVGCSGTTCDDNCFHFKGEACSSQGVNFGITMGAECGTGTHWATAEVVCEMKNHPAVWQALKDTETSDNMIALPTGDIKPCYNNGTDCVRTKDELPPLLCHNFVPFYFGGAKCTDTNQCGLCMGICEKDSECKGDLKCFLRTGEETVPGCSSSYQAVFNAPGKGYCANIPDSSGRKGGEIAAIAIGALLLSAAVGALVWWCKKTKRGFFGFSGGMAEPIKL